MRMRCLLLCLLTVATSWLTAGDAARAAPARAATPAAPAVDPALLAGLKARSIGPAGMSGRVTAIEAVVAHPETVYVGAATGGVWKSTNGGLSFDAVFDDQPVHAIGSIGIFQPNPQIVWVGTGEGNVRNSASVGNGIYRSLDGGTSWEHLGLDKTERIYRVLTHPSDPDLAYACALGQEWGENPERGVFRTRDGGKSWQKVLYVDERTGCGELVMDPGNPNKLLASMWQFRRWPYFFKSGGPGSGLYVTHDGGDSWSRQQEEDGLPAGELGRIGLAFSRSNPEIVYALVEAETSALLRSENGGKSWKSVNTSPGVASRPFYFGEIRVDPLWPNRVYNISQLIRVSDDGGRSFTPLRGAAWRAIHGDYQAMWIHPSDASLIYVGDDGGMAVSRDHGESFQFVSTLPLAQFYHVAYDMDTPYHVYGGLQDNGSWRGPSASTKPGGMRNHEWYSVGFGDGFDVQPDPQDSSLGYSMSQGGYLMRWNLKTGESKMIRPPAPDGTRLRFNWNAGLALDPFTPQTLYYGSQFVHRSRDRGESWEIISPDLTSNNPEWQKQDESGGLTLDVTAAENYTTILTIAPSPLVEGLLWVGTDDGRVQLTRDGGSTWTSLEANLKGVPANTWVPHIEASKFDPAEAFVVLDNHRRSDLKPYVYRTRDYGQTWTSLATPNLNGYALVVEQDPVARDLLFLGSEFGLYVSLDGGASWLPFKHGLPTASVMDLGVHPRENDLIIATHGRSIFIVDDISPLRQLSAASLAEPLHLYLPARVAQHWIGGQEGGYGLGAGEYRGTNRPYGALLSFSLNQPGLPLPDDAAERARKEKERQAARTAKAESKGGDEAKPSGPGGDPKVAIEVADASGKQLRRFEVPAKLGLNRAVWDFSSDDFKQPPRDEPVFFGDDGGGAQVPPGEYTVTVRFGEQSATGKLQVLADPQSTNTPADWQRRWEAIQRIGGLNDRAVDAIVKVRRTRADIDTVAQKLRDAARDAGEKDPKKINDQPLIQEGQKVQKSLTELENQLWQAPGRRGIPPDTDLFSTINQCAWFVGSSWDPPSPSHLAYIEQAEKQLQTVEGAVAKLWSETVEPYIAKVKEAGVGLFGGK